MTVFSRLNLYKTNSYEIDAMAQNLGDSKEFTFYTLDNEPISHYPHVHICVKKDPKFKGKLLKNNSPYMSLGSIKLRPDNDYTIENLEFETIEDPYITNRKNKKIFVDWLLSNTKKRKFGNILNCDLCIYLYLASNKQCQDRQAYEDYLDKEN